jgi:RimJ/RimL family protein N-acetyltransferase
VSVALRVHSPAPAFKRTGRLLLRPLRASDVDRDYDAVMASRAELRAWSQTSWPADDFTREENLADLERHEREHVEGVAYTFTVLDPDGARCLGCVYLTPPSPGAMALIADARHPVNVAFWVRSETLAERLDAHLLEAVREWLAVEWTFDRVVFTIARDAARQAEVLRAAGLEPLGDCALPDGRACVVYGEAGA